MLQAVDGKAAEVTVEQFQVGEDSVGQLMGKFPEVAGNDAPVLCGAFRHGTEGGALFAHGRSPVIVLSMLRRGERGNCHQGDIVGVRSECDR
jgi:hypothetical protein